MKKFFKEIKNDKTIPIAFLSNAFLIIATFIYVLFSYNKLPPLVPIFNQLPWGEQRLGATFTIFIPTTIALLILIINLFLSALIYGKIPLISRMLSAISLLTGILTLLFTIKTIVVLI
jgi:hypothetical protein